MKRAQEIEDGFKELHSGIYTWGRKKLEIAIKAGYVESVAGFKLYLPNYEEFEELHTWYKTLDRKFWNKYSLGKRVYKTYYRLKDIKERAEEDEIKFQKVKELFDKPYSITYNNSKKKVSRYAKLKSEYFKLCLNNPQHVGVHSN